MDLGCVLLAGVWSGESHQQIGHNAPFMLKPSGFPKGCNGGEVLQEVDQNLFKSVLGCQFYLRRKGAKLISSEKVFF